MDKKEWEAMLYQVNLTIDKRNRLALLSESNNHLYLDFKSQILYYYLKSKSINPEPPILGTEQGLEDLLNYLRGQPKESLQKFVKEKKLIDKLTQLSSTECEGHHDKEVVNSQYCSALF
ncbi:hypothetical protein FGO68_gene8093 [Halteria grandinella]|uniref:Uncharacterized protein n=1 Tax=Halteria grandinella TaxID=5974 RepID=A0A8J8SUI0_HALGN|nr:hypothetical protein FGO68_gene8093 [Halteria grandinella]